MKFTKKFLGFMIILFLFAPTIAQAQVKDNLKGNLYAYWGWNFSWYTNSDITFQGDDYNFTLDDVVAKDRQTPFSFKQYLSPTEITIPQYNFRLGYYLDDETDVSIAIDHMKYVVQENQVVNAQGTIQEPTSIYQGDLTGDVALTPEFLTFEHTDGLNYVNAEYRKNKQFYNGDKVDVRGIYGAGLGVMLPKTNVRLFGKERHDEVNLAGYGTAAIGGANILFFDRVFLQTELKGGYINMNNVRTTKSSSDEANHDFWFSQYNFMLGANFPLTKNK